MQLTQIITFFFISCSADRIYSPLARDHVQYISGYQSQGFSCYKLRREENNCEIYYVNGTTLLLSYKPIIHVSQTCFGNKVLFRCVYLMSSISIFPFLSQINFTQETRMNIISFKDMKWLIGNKSCMKVYYFILIIQ